MIQFAYLSSARALFTADDIADILAKSRANNERLGITGMLLYKEGSILQVLEGERDTVVQLFEKISRDARHRNILRVYEKEVTARDFPEWTMGFHDLKADGARQLQGYSEFMDPTFDLSTVKPSQAAKLMAIFKGTFR